MPPRRSASQGRTEQVRTEALLVRATPLREADLLLTVLTPERGLVEISAPSARRSSKRFQGLEPLHVLRIAFELRAPGGVSTPQGGGRLTEASIERPRTGILCSLEATLAAGRALRWVRAALPIGVADLAVWQLTNQLLDELDRGSGPEATLGARGLALLAAFGWGFELGACVRCGRAPPTGSAACFDFEAGGLVCRACGGGPELIRADELQLLGDAQLGRLIELPPHATQRALGWVERALARA